MTGRKERFEMTAYEMPGSLGTADGWSPLTDAGMQWDDIKITQTPDARAGIIKLEINNGGEQAAIARLPREDLGQLPALLAQALTAAREALASDPAGYWALSLTDGAGDRQIIAITGGDGAEPGRWRVHAGTVGEFREASAQTGQLAQAFVALTAGQWDPGLTWTAGPVIPRPAPWMQAVTRLLRCLAIGMAAGGLAVIWSATARHRALVAQADAAHQSPTAIEATGFAVTVLTITILLFAAESVACWVRNARAGRITLSASQAPLNGGEH
jgi:hypothetical protein